MMFWIMASAVVLALLVLAYYQGARKRKETNAVLGGLRDSAVDAVKRETGQAVDFVKKEVKKL